MTLQEADQQAVAYGLLWIVQCKRDLQRLISHIQEGMEMNSWKKIATAMPPKAGNAQLSDDDIKAAVDFLLAAAK